MCLLEMLKLPLLPSMSWQLNDMERFLSNNHHFGVLTGDTTFNLGVFYVTVVTYPQLMLQDVTMGKHPKMVGPVLVHQQTA